MRVRRILHRCRLAPKHLWPHNANNQVDKKDDAHDPILRDLCTVKDNEIKAHAGTAAILAPRYDSRRGGGYGGI